MTRILVVFLSAVLAFSPSTIQAAAGDPAILEIHVVEGDGSSYTTGSRATRGVTVLVTDETGRSVEGATVSFSLPPDGPSGVFSSGSRTEIATTRANGQAAAWGMQWNETPGPLEIRITAVKGPARAGTTTSQYLTASAARATQAASEAKPAVRSSIVEHSRLPVPGRGFGFGNHKWIWITAALAGVAMASAGLAARQSGGGSTAAAPTGVQIGTPTIILGRQ